MIQFDLARSEPDPVIRRRLCVTIITRASKVESAIRKVFQKFKASVSGPLYWPEMSTLKSTTDDPELGKVFPISFHFPTFSVAQVLTTYWSSVLTVNFYLACTCSILLATDDTCSFAKSTMVLTSTDDGTTSTDTSRSIEPPTSPPSSSVSTTSSQPHLSQRHKTHHQSLTYHSNLWQTTAKNLCQSVEYHISEQSGALGSLLMLTHMRGCRAAFAIEGHARGRELSWCEEIIELIKGRFDFDVGPIFEEEGEGE